MKGPRVSRERSTGLRPLEAAKLYSRCDPAELGFESTADLQPLDTVLGQPRALEALRFGTGIRRQGYHLCALGPPGTGERTLVRLILDERAAREPAPPDLCYVNNFDAPHRRACSSCRPAPAHRGALARDGGAGPVVLRIGAGRGTVTKGPRAAVSLPGSAS